MTREQVRTMAKLIPFVPSRRDPWDARKARHLLNRIGFGAAPEEVEALVKRGFDEAVHRIVHYENIPDPLGSPAWLNQPLDLPELPAGAELGRPKNAPEANAPGASPPNPAPGAANPASPDREQLRRARQALMRGNRLRNEALRAWWL